MGKTLLYLCLALAGGLAVVMLSASLGFGVSYLVGLPFGAALYFMKAHGFLLSFFAYLFIVWELQWRYLRAWPWLLRFMCFLVLPLVSLVFGQGHITSLLLPLIAASLLVYQMCVLVGKHNRPSADK